MQLLCTAPQRSLHCGCAAQGGGGPGIGHSGTAPTTRSRAIRAGRSLPYPLTSPAVPSRSWHGRLPWCPAPLALGISPPFGMWQRAHTHTKRTCRAVAPAAPALSSSPQVTQVIGRGFSPLLDSYNGLQRALEVRACVRACVHVCPRTPERRHMPPAVERARQRAARTTAAHSTSPVQARGQTLAWAGGCASGRSSMLCWVWWGVGASCAIPLARPGDWRRPSGLGPPRTRGFPPAQPPSTRHSSNTARPPSPINAHKQRQQAAPCALPHGTWVLLTFAPTPTYARRHAHACGCARRRAARCC